MELLISLDQQITLSPFSLRKLSISPEVCYTIQHITTTEDVDICTHKISHTEDPPMYAQHPTPEFHVLNDDRTGFWKHASIEISLERPRGTLV